jgi:hypothetical protein
VKRQSKHSVQNLSSALVLPVTGSDERQQQNLTLKFVDISVNLCNNGNVGIVTGIDTENRLFLTQV